MITVMEKFGFPKLFNTKLLIGIMNTYHIYFPQVSALHNHNQWEKIIVDCVGPVPFVQSERGSVSYPFYSQFD